MTRTGLRAGPSENKFSRIGCPLNADMQKDNFFTKTCFQPKILYPKKCVNYDKSTLRKNSVKGQTDPDSAKNSKK